MTNSGYMADQSVIKKRMAVFSILILLFVVLMMIDLLKGTVKIPAGHILALLAGKSSENEIWRSILFEFRMPKTIAAVLAGSALSVSGLQMQTIFRNPLAGPDVLGVSAGASLGVAIVVMGFGNAILSESISWAGSWVQIISACVGAGMVLFLVMMVSLKVRDIMTILILGILFGSAASALVSVMQFFSPQSMLKAFVIWSMGNLGNLTHVQLKVLSISLTAGFLITFLTMKVMNAMLLGENYSKSMGVRVRSSRFLIFLSTSLLSGSITAFCGPLAFVGIAVPHVARLLFGTSNHFILVPASMLIGAALMLLADIISQIPASGIILPINSVTAMLGIPVVVWVIVYNKRFARLN